MKRRLTTTGVALVVLSWESVYDGYGLPYGPNGTFEFLRSEDGSDTLETARTQGRHPDIASRNGMPAAEFLALARAGAGGA